MVEKHFLKEKKNYDNETNKKKESIQIDKNDMQYIEREQVPVLLLSTNPN
jgi:hypothetical protein